MSLEDEASDESSELGVSAGFFFDFLDFFGFGGSGLFDESEEASTADSEEGSSEVTSGDGSDEASDSVAIIKVFLSADFGGTSSNRTFLTTDSVFLADGLERG